MLRLKIGERLRQIRIHRELTQADLVDGICSMTYISRIENGKIKPSISFLRKVASRLEVELSFLLDSDNDKSDDDIERIFLDYQTEKNLDQQDLSLLRLTALENHSSATLAKIYYMLISYFTNRDIELADLYVAQAGKLISNTISPPVDEALISYFESLSHYHYVKQNYSEAYFFVNIVSRILPADCPGVRRAKNHYNLSLIRQHIDEDLELARFHSKEALAIFKEIDDSRGITASLVNLAVQSHRNGLYEDSLAYLDELASLTESNPSNHYNSILNYNYGRVYQHLKQYDKAYTYFNASIDNNIQAGKEQGSIHALKCLIEMNIELKSWDEVHNHLTRAFNLTESYHLPYPYIELLHYKAKLFKVRADEPAYEKEMQNAVNLAQEGTYSLLIRRLSGELADHYNDLRAYKMAAKYYKIALEHVQ
ncbi:helix-turn-helix domain-containing protein [Sporosarcina sp. NPDC096371]|uniref:helix-turn-helix domain-containing protein n=1 Tax=Sporosarcina sp. NPDC096371 TaxID=3364530 RepID=UPI0038120E1C